jgi:putative hydrolase of the HAD superfamily
MIKAVIFDLDDTLYDCNYTNNPASVEAVCRYTAEELLHIEVERVRAAFDEARLSVKEDMLGDEAAQHNRLLYFQRTLEILGYPPISYALEMHQYFWRDFLNRITLYEGAEAFLHKLRQQGIKIAICTDMTTHIQHRKLRRLGIGELIDVLVTSEEAGAEKPAPEIYRMVLRKLQVRPEEAVFIGDSLKKDVEGPAGLGMKAIWFHEGKQQVPYEQAESYRELEEIFKKMSENAV